MTASTAAIDRFSLAHVVLRVPAVNLFLIGLAGLLVDLIALLDTLARLG